MSRPPPRKPPGRRPGSRSPDHESKKRALARRMLGAVVQARGRPSLHELARVGEASIPTVNHYFGDRSGAVAAALRTVEEDAAAHLAGVADPGDADLASSLRTMATELARAWRPFGLGALFAAGLAAGITDPVAGPGYLDGVLEPTVRALERRLHVHAARGELDAAPDDETAIRVAALAFLSPVLVALLHQHELSGDRCRPLDLDAFLDQHVRRFTAAYGRSPRALR